MESIHFLWALHGIRKVEVSGMGGDKMSDRAINRCCWVELRGLPLSAWYQELFELVASIFGKMVSVYQEMEKRKHLGAARLEILTS
ncbi:hypothetical protein Tsubulata_008305 [Turnera subulata]|uniref:DUF4283 domain-containing protein n=1 Tax=Turnera subulata TaxID=218843 RepID=A0A9Q0FWZ7_9ROSI|nr:hypothetical protein Tsubulata_008305 [Turnera subulata]